MPFETIYILLLGEGTEVFRPVLAERLQDGTFIIQGTIPAEERWSFRPGERVVVRRHTFSGGATGLEAYHRTNEADPPLQNWRAVKLEAARSIVASSERFDPATVRNVEKFVKACENRVQTPIGVAKGYWNTICISWDRVEVEIFNSRYELYEFHDRSTAIEYFDTTPEEPVSEKLIERLPCLKIEG